jgi:hypothetical protein
MDARGHTRPTTTSQNIPGRQDPVDDPRRQTHEDRVRDANRDPLAREPGAHAAGTVAGAALGGAAGAVLGAVAGPVGAVVGAGLGVVAGGLAGKGVAEAVNPSEEQAHWKHNFERSQYAGRGRTFEECEPAYRFGWEACVRYGGRSFDDVEDELGREWDSHRGRSDLGWMEARPAARDAWTRVQSRIHERGRAEGRIIT